MQGRTSSWELAGVGNALGLRHPMAQLDMLLLRLSGQETPHLCQELHLRERELCRQQEDGHVLDGARLRSQH